MKQKAQQEEAERFQLYLPPALAKQVREEAKKNYRSISGEVSFILEQYFKSQEQQKTQ